MQQPFTNEKWSFHQPVLGGCTLLSVKNDTSPTLSMMDAAVHIPAVRMLRCSIWLSSLKASALGLPSVWSSSVAAGKAEVGYGLEGGEDGKPSHSSASCLSIPLGKGVMTSAPNCPFHWPLLVSFLSSSLQ